MPGRIALGAAAWWEPIIAAGLTLAAIAGLVAFAGRVYTGAILHTGATLKLRDAWRGTPTPAAPDQAHAARSPTRLPTARSARNGTPTRTTTDSRTNVVLVGIGVVAGAAVFALARDVIMGLAVGAGIYAVGSRLKAALRI
jgi:hypothetical protein